MTSIPPAVILSNMASQLEYTIRRGKKEDMVGAHKLCLEQGWNISIEFLNFHFDLFPEGVYIAEGQSGEILCHCAAVCLDDSTAFVAYYVTKHSCRGQGIGRKVFDLCMEALGNRNVGLNSAWDRQRAYASGGFGISTFTLATYSTAIKDINTQKMLRPLDIKVVNAKDVDFEDLMAYDKKISPIERPKVLQWLLGIAKVALVATDENGVITGFGSLYPAQYGYRLMPLYADTPQIAAVIVNGLISQVSEEKESLVEVFFPSENQDAKNMYGELGMMSGEGFLSMRMFTQCDVPVPTDKAYSLFNYANVLI